MPAPASRKKTAEKPGKPLRADARDNREKLLAAARRLFDRRGVDVGVDDVAREAGLGVGTFYRHFPTKEALFQATVVSHMEDLVAAAREALDADDGEAAFFGFLARFVDLGRRKKTLLTALAKQGVALPAGDARVSHALHETLAAVVARAQRERVLREGITAAELVALVRGTYAALDAGAGEASRARLFDVLCDGLRAPRGRRA